MLTDYENAKKRIEIRDVKEIKSNTLRVTLAFHTSEFGTIAIKGFRVSPSLNYAGYWVQPPAMRIYGSYLQLFFAENSMIWQLIEKILIELYLDHYPASGEGSSIDIDEIVNDLDRLL